MKKIVSIILVLIMAFSVMPLAYAEASDVAVQPSVQAAEDNSVSPCAEQVGWVYRYNSELQRYEKRLWSYTYGVWLTDWIPCNV